MLFAATIAAAAIASFALRSRPALLAAVGFALWAAVPGVGVSLVTGMSGASFGFHPASWFLMAGTVWAAAHDPRAFSIELGRRFWLYLVLLTVVVEALLVTRMGSTPTDIVTVVDQVLAPVLLFLLAAVGLAQSPGSARRTLIGTVLVVAALESGFALVQLAANQPIFYTAGFEGQDWYTPGTWTRWMGTTDHPLNLGLLLAAATPLLAGLRHSWLRWPAVALFGAGVLITQSRTATAAFVIGVVYILVRAAMPAVERALATVVLVVLAGIAVTSTLAAGLQSRIANDTGSSSARAAAIDFFSTSWGNTLFFGDGITAGFDVSASAGLITSFESSIIMYAVGIGIVFTLLYFGAQVFLVGRYALLRVVEPGRVRVPGVLLSGLVMLVLPQSYSALAAETLAAPLLWTVLALTTTTLPAVSRGRADQAVAPPVSATTSS